MHIHIYMYTYMYLYAHICIYLYTYTYFYTHISTSIYIYIHSICMGSLHVDFILGYIWLFWVTLLIPPHKVSFKMARVHSPTHGDVHPSC